MKPRTKKKLFRVSFWNSYVLFAVQPVFLGMYSLTYQLHREHLAPLYVIAAVLHLFFSATCAMLFGCIMRDNIKGL